MVKSVSGADKGNSSRPRALLAHIQASLPTMRKADRLVADFILSDPEKVVSSSAADVGARSQTSVGTVIGFCHRLGLEGFSDLRIALARDLAQSGLPAGRREKNGSVLEKVLEFHQECLREIVQINEQKEFDATVELLRKAKRIEFFSMGISYPVAYSAASKLMLVGFPAVAQIDAHLQLISATQLSRGDVAFGISSSGSTRETIACLEVAKQGGATTVAITNALGSEIALVSDRCLYATPSEIKYFQAPLASRITQMAIFDALFVALVDRRKRQTGELLQRASEALAQFR